MPDGRLMLAGPEEGGSKKRSRDVGGSSSPEDDRRGADYARHRKDSERDRANCSVSPERKDRR